MMSELRHRTKVRTNGKKACDNTDLRAEPRSPRAQATCKLTAVLVLIVAVRGAY